MKPFIKRCGGKSKLVPYLMEDLPEFNVYHEPFLGGGALFCALQVQQACLSDIEPGLIAAWKQVKEDPQDLMNLLDTYPYTKEFFFCLQSQEPHTLLEEAARFIYLNRSCFKGVMPYDKFGNMNLAWAGEFRSTPYYYVASNLWDIHRSLKNVELRCQSFEESLSLVESGDLVFLDPPYFESSDIYTHEDFNFSIQLKLSSWYDSLVNRGAYVILTNKNCSIIRDIYKKYRLSSVEVTQFVKKGKQSDLIVRNW